MTGLSRSEVALAKKIDAQGRLTPETKRRLMEIMEERWPEHKRPKGYPTFDPDISDGCSAGVRQIAQLACAIHDMDYNYGQTWRDKVVADWNLTRNIWSIGYQKASDPDDPQPYLSLPAWWALGAARGVGVLFGGWGAFRKKHKRAKKQ